MLDITKENIDISKNITSPYIRILGFNSNGKFLISQISKKNPKLKFITSVKKFVDTNSDKNLTLMLNKDIFATNVYTIGYNGMSFGNLDYTKKLVIEK